MYRYFCGQSRDIGKLDSALTLGSILAEPLGIKFAPLKILKRKSIIKEGENSGSSQHQGKVQRG